MRRDTNTRMRKTYQEEMNTEKIKNASIWLKNCVYGIKLKSLIQTESFDRNLAENGSECQEMKGNFWLPHKFIILFFICFPLCDVNVG